jgi:hypothetical protein
MNKLMALALLLVPACTIYISAEESDDGSDGPSDDAPPDPIDAGPPGDLDVLSVDFLGLDLDEWSIWEPEDRKNDPRAEDPSYVYLVTDQDGVVLTGPPIADAGLFYLDNPYVNDLSTSFQGFEVTFNPRLTYRVDISDYEYEVVATYASLIREGGTLYPRIIVVAAGDAGGVAHDVRVTAYVDGQQASESTAPLTIEARPGSDDGWIIWQPEERQNDPRAGAPEYVYLEIGVDGVELPLPVAPIDGAELGLVGTYAGAEVASERPGGILIELGGVQAYRFEIEDFEDELSVERLELWQEADGMHGRVVLVADGLSGVAHEVTLVYTYTDEGPSTGPWTIEAREPNF